MSIAEKYGARLERGNLKDDSLRRLIEDYPSHGFVIDVTEAEELFEEVREPTPAEANLAHFLVSYVDKGMEGNSAIVEILSELVQNDTGENNDEHNDKETDDNGTVQENAGGAGQEATADISDSQEGEHSASVESSIAKEHRSLSAQLATK